MLIRNYFAMANFALCLSISRYLIRSSISCKIYNSSDKHSLRFVTMPRSWQTEKESLLSLSKEEKRKVMKEYIQVDNVQKWPEYSADNIASKKLPTDEDRALFAKTVIDATLSQSLANKVSIYRGDITKLEVDAIVNAANSKLLGGGGVDGAIHRAAGPLLLEECRQLHGCSTGDAKITGGYELPAKYVIHTVGPQDKSTSKLESCYEKCFSLQSENKLTSIAFPCVSTGIYGFPNRLAAHIALSVARNALEKDARDGNILERVIFCTFLPVDVEIYETLLQLYFPFE